MSAAKAKPAREGIDPAKVRVLLEAWDELEAKQAQIVAELRRLAGGGKPIGELLREAEAAFASAWAGRYQGQTYFWNYTKDRPSMKKYVLALGVDELAARFGRYIQNADPFFLKSKHSFAVFVSTINQHAAMSDAGGFALDGDGGDHPVGCTHSPYCKDDVEHTRKKIQDMKNGFYPADKNEAF